MTSATLQTMVAKAIAEAHPELDVAGLDKTATLRAVMDAGGWRAVVDVGRAVRELTWHPVIRALVASSDPKAVVERWMRLERFGHTRNRTELVDDALTIRHFALDGGSIAEVNDLFIWGVLIGLLEAAGVDAIEAAIVSEAEPFVVFGDERASTSSALPARTEVLLLRGRARADVALAQEGRTDSRALRQRLAALVERDLLERWTIADAARTLAVSVRTLQRALREEGTTFSEVVQRTRVESAEGMMSDERLELTDIAFCVGFSDQAHFTRTFRRYYEIPPSAFRDILP